MLDLLNFAFSGFWTFVGCWILLGLVVKGIVGLMLAIMRVPVTNNITHNHGARK